jgi:hypothetical protein
MLYSTIDLLFKGIYKAEFSSLFLVASQAHSNLQKVLTMPSFEITMFSPNKFSIFERETPVTHVNLLGEFKKLHLRIFAPWVANEDSSDITPQTGLFNT